MCSPPSGTCEFDHTVTPENKRELCFHKEKCSYKPYCIFFHPEGQTEGGWQQSRNKVAKICRYAEQGNICLRSICNFYHPSLRNNSDFHWDQQREPPLIEETERMSSPHLFHKAPVRVPVIVSNNLQLKSKKEFPDLTVSLKGLALD